jgi:hypothetical protein
MNFSSDRLLCWNGQVPIHLKIAKNAQNASSFSSFFFLAQRCSYLPLYDALASRNFGRVLSLAQARIILHDGQAALIPWHLPIGVLYDWFVASHSHAPDLFLNIQLDITEDGAGGQQHIGLEQVSMAFFGRLKEADAVSQARMTSRMVPKLPQSVQAAIFDTVVSQNFIKHVQSNPFFSANDDKKRRVPVRIYPGGIVLAMSPEDVLREDFLCQGIVLSEGTVISQAYGGLAHPDGFLYLLRLSNSAVS